MAMFLKVLCLFVVAALSGASAWPWPWNDHNANNKNLNWVLDSILQTISRDLVLQHGDQITVPDSSIDTKKTVQFWFIPVDLAAKATDNGILSNLSSVVRVSDAVIEQSPTNGGARVVLQADLKLNNMQMKYDTASVQFYFLSHDGPLSIKCADNVFNVGVEVSSSGTCSTEVKSAAIKTMSGCSVELENGGFLGFIKQWLYSLALRQVVEEIVDAENKALLPILKPIIENHNLCQFLNPISS